VAGVVLAHNRRDWAIRKCEQFGTEGRSKGLMAALKISFECSILYRLLLFSGRTLPNRAASRKATELSIQLSAFGSALLWGRLQTVMSWFDQKAAVVIVMVKRRDTFF
jgi:hypothetical protein